MKTGGRRGLMAEINVTPLVDVMLVLLIIFMITAPMLSTGIEVELPETRAGELRGKEPLLLVVDREGRVHVGRQEVPLERLGAWLREAKRTGLLREVNVRADRRCPYGVVARVLAEIQGAGIESIGLVTRPENER